MYTFKDRHIGINVTSEQEMCKVVGVEDTEELINQVVPDSIKVDNFLKLSAPLTEHEYLNHIDTLGKKNILAKNYIGQGYYSTITPAAIRRNIFENPAWYTAYTPYQAEISQGRLEALLNFQTMITDLTAMEIANASLLDEATAASEAMILTFNNRTKEQKSKRVNTFFLDTNCFAQTKAQIRSRAKFLGIEIVENSYNEIKDSASFFGGVVQYPDANGVINNYKEFTEKFKSSGAKLVVVADILSLTLLTPPGKWNVDVVVGSTQRFGVPLGFGGPHAAYFATKEEYRRSIPGRIIGVSIDADDNPALRMALQTREQHIKRDRATSNICTSQVLLAVMASMYAVYHGKEGLIGIAEKINKYANNLHSNLLAMGFKSLSNSFFDTISISLASSQLTDLKKLAEDKNINFFYSKDTVKISIGEGITQTAINDIQLLFSSLKSSKAVLVAPSSFNSAIPKELKRKEDFLQYETFKVNRTETQLMRYIKRLEIKDLSLVHSMISLGSCTMKLNATTELEPLSNANWANIHPFAPKYQTQGYVQMLNELATDLANITGFDKVTLQPNSGAQGEYTGLYAIRNYQESKNQGHRNIAFIPSSAHGTNPASAVMSGLKVVVIKCDEKGNIDIEDLKEKVIQYSENLCCIMITYPSTHGVYEEHVLEITSLIHENGGQVYMDGANMNAQVGITNPAKIGADVCHLNLHKTFAIPHGGGGPGVGPIGVRKHLTPYLPSHPLNEDYTANDYTISAANYGSASICLISYGYIKLLGAEGLTRATKMAILNANYIKSSLESDFKVLYTNRKDRVAHEMILDCRVFKALTKVEVVDIAKRLIDYGFHAPTVSFPVNGTLMVEPTESEDKEQLDTFIRAMKSIKQEILNIEQQQNVDNNLLKNAPHTVENICQSKWDKEYTIKEAVFPLGKTNGFKYWAPISRINDAHGDRNLVCSCVGVENYA